MQVVLGKAPIKCLPSKVVFHQRLSFVKGRLPSKVVFHQRLSSIESCLPSKVVFNQRSSSIKVVFHQRLPSLIDRLPSKVVFYQRFECGIAQPGPYVVCSNVLHFIIPQPQIPKILKNPLY